ncbi:MAG: hypothetical protein MSA09_03420 [Lachnospiraceae bacterium]|nr:hypothetical protein [Lachnospiraceae bacterium]
MGNTELDMELTPKREAKIKETLLRLFADQNGWDYKDMEVTIKKKVESA